MRKNKMMRAASTLLVAVLLTTSAISGTFAKYVTEASSTDTARVAKWGVYVTSTSDMFQTTYAKDDTTTVTNIENSVVSSDTNKLVAPGTTKSDVAFTITGTPEVAVNVAVSIDKLEGNDAVKDVFLKAGEYTDYTKVTGYDAMTGEVTYGTFTLTDDYYPLVWTLKDGETQVATGKLSDIEAYLESTGTTTGLSGNYAPNTNLSEINSATGNYTLSWTWAFESSNDAADTLLGNLAVDSTLIDAANYCLDVAYTLKIVVTQID